MTKTSKHEDRIVRSVSCMTSWADLKEAMDKGYVPTMLSRSANAQKFCRLLRSRGYKVFDGKRTY